MQGISLGKAPVGKPFFLCGLARVHVHSGHRKAGDPHRPWHDGHRKWLGVGRTYSCIPERNSASISRDSDLPLDFCFKDGNLTDSHKSTDTGAQMLETSANPNFHDPEESNFTHIYPTSLCFFLVRENGGYREIELKTRSFSL